MHPVLTELHATARRNEFLATADRHRRTREVHRRRTSRKPAVHRLSELLARISVRRRRQLEPAPAA